MATITKSRIQVRTISGNSPEIREGFEGALCTHKAGAVLFMSASGRLRPLPTANLSRADVAQGIAGVAIKDGANFANSNTTASRKVPFYVANDDTVFISNIASRTSVATATYNARYQGTVCGGSVNASRFYPSIKMVAATNSLCVVRGLYEQDAHGDTYARVYFQFLRTARAFK